MQHLPRTAVLFALLCVAGVAHADAAPEPPAQPSSGRAAEPPATGEHAAVQLCEPMDRGCFANHDGLWRDPQEIYRQRLALKEPNRLRTWGWMTLSLGAGTFWYWMAREQNSVDWDLNSWSQRFEKSSYRYDANEFPINWLWHPLSGTAFYALSRINDLTVVESAAVSVLTSFAWEFLLEYKERVSINDTLATPLAGISLGEYFFRLGEFLYSAPGGGGPGHKALQWTAGLPVTLHGAWDDEPHPPRDAPSTRAGFGRKLAGEFVLGAGASINRSDENHWGFYEAVLESTLFDIPGFMRQGDFRLGFADANVTSLWLRAGGSPEGRATELEAESILAGLHHQRLLPSATGLVGHAVTVGTSVNFLFRRQEFDSYTDYLSTVGLPGLALDARWVVGPFTLVSKLRLHGEFGGFDTPAYDDWEADNPDVVTKTVLQKMGYYYGWGGTGRALLEARLPWLRVGASLLAGSYHSREGVDRWQERLEDDFPLRDRQLRYEGWLRFIVPGPGVYIGVSTLSLLRDSRVPDHRRYWRLDRHMLSLGIVR